MVNVRVEIARMETEAVEREYERRTRFMERDLP